MSGIPSANLALVGRSLTLNLWFPTLPPGVEDPRISLMVATAGQFPDDPEAAPYKNVSSGGSSTTTSVRIALPSEKPLTELSFEARYVVRNGREAEGSITGGFRFRVTSGPSGFEPVLEPSEQVNWSPLPLSKSGIHGVAERTKDFPARGRFVRAKHAGGERFLVIHDSGERALGLLDVGSQDWVAKLGLEEEETVRFAANATHLFVCREKENTLVSYQLPDLKEAKRISLNDAAPPLDLAIGSLSADAPLMLFYSNRISLRDPASLKHADEVICVRDRQKSKHSFEVGEGRIWHRNLKRLLARASPSGNVVLVQGATTTSQPGRFDELFTIQREPGYWLKSPSRWFVPGPAGLRYSRSGVVSALGKVVVKPDSRTQKVYLPAGTGYVAVSGDFYRGQHPPPRALLEYYPDHMAKEPLFSVEAAQAAFTSLRSWEDLSERIFLFPSHGKVVSLAPRGVTIEDFRIVGDASSVPLVSTPAMAKRGVAWSYSSTHGRTERVTLSLLNGPPGARINNGTTIEWQVPADFPDPVAEFKLQLAGSGPSSVTRTLAVGVTGLRSPRIRASTAVEASPVPTNSVFFRRPIDRIFPSLSRGIVVVASGGYRQFTAIDLATLKTVGFFESSAGSAAAALHSTSLILWYGHAGAIEQLSLPDLRPSRMQAVDGTDRLLALIAGSGEGALPPIAILHRPGSSNPSVYGRVLDPGSLTLGEPIPLPGLSSHIGPEANELVGRWASCADGSLVCDSTRMVVQERGGVLKTRRFQDPQTARRQPITFAPGARTLFIANKAIDLEANRMWSAGDRFAMNSALVPDHDGQFVLLAERNKGEYSVALLDAGTQARLFKLDGLEEWRGPDEGSSTQAEQWLTGDIQYWSKSGVLLTISYSRHHLVARRLDTVLKGEQQ